MLLPLILNFLYGIVLVLASPIILYRMVVKGKYWKTLSQRLGFFSVNKPADVWIHGVSVGEIKAVQPLLKKLEAKFPDILVSSTSSRGLQVARELYPHHPVISFPVDFSWSVKRFLKRIRPRLIVLMELELWPNFLFYAGKQNIPVILLNGRISERSARRFSYIRPLFARLTRNIKLFCVQSNLYAERLLKLGIEKERIQVTGNMKFDTEDGIRNISVEQLRKQLGLIPEHTVWIAGSTHRPEEQYVVSCYRELVRQFPDLRLIIVPRHPERADEVAQCIQNAGFGVRKKSRIGADCTPLPENEILLGDTMGELARLYCTADLAFVGGSLLRHGGQNFIEPARLGKIVMCGPFTHNFPDFKVFLEEKAAFQIQSPQEMKDLIQKILQNPEEYKNVGEKARILVESYRGSVQKNLALCEALLKK